METPISSRRFTASSRVENEESNNMGVLKSKQNGNNNQEREKTALIDITNSSPIVGLAMGSLKTPSSKKRMMVSNTIFTPGSGETLLRGQVKTLLQKVEEEGVISKISFEPNSLIYKRFMNNSPMAILAPTPANTPQVYNFGNNNELESFTVSPVAESFNFTQMLNEAIAESSQEEEGVITRSLFMEDDCDASECSSVLTDQDSNASLWSVEVNASTSEEYKEDLVVDELCEVLSQISVNKHTRFVYESEEEVEKELTSSSPPSSSKTSQESCA